MIAYSTEYYSVYRLTSVSLNGKQGTIHYRRSREITDLVNENNLKRISLENEIDLVLLHLHHVTDKYFESKFLSYPTLTKCNRLSDAISLKDESGIDYV